MAAHLQDGTWAISLTAVGSFVSGFLASIWYRALCDFFDPPEALPRDLIVELRVVHRELVLTRSTLRPETSYSDYILPIAVVVFVVAWFLHFANRSKEDSDEETEPPLQLRDGDAPRVRPGAARSRRTLKEQGPCASGLSLVDARTTVSLRLTISLSIMYMTLGTWLNASF